MSLQTLEVNGIELDIYYQCDIQKDPYGTGDSPTNYEVTIDSIELSTDPTDIQELIADRTYQYILDQIINIESDN